MSHCSRRSTTARLAKYASLVAASALLAACGGSASPAAPAASPAPTASSSAPSSSAATPPAASKPLQKVTLRLDWFVSGYHAPYVVAKDLGYYKQAGFDVSIKQGKGSAVTTQIVANGADAFGLADAGTAATLISKGAPAKMLAIFTQQSPLSFIYNKPFKLTNLHQLIGKTILTAAGSATYTILPAVLSTAGIKTSQMHVNFVDPVAEAATLKHNPSFIVLGFDTDDLQEIQKVNPQAVHTSYAHFGINTLSTGLVTSTKLIQQHPGEVRRFVGATIKGWQYTIQHPATAVADLVKAFPAANKAVQAAELKQALTMLHTPNSQGKPIGWMSSKDWKQTVGLLHKYSTLKTIKPLNDYYTNKFLP